MTCIVGLISDNKVYMGGDSAGVAGFDIRVRKDPKVFSNGEFLIGYTSSFRMGQLLRFNLSPPPLKEGQDIFEYMATSFVNAVRYTLKDGGYTEISNNVESGGFFLVGFRGRLFTIESDFQVQEVLDDYTALGCGENYALGSLYSTKGLKPMERVEQALRTAEYFSAGVRGPFIIKET